MNESIIDRMWTLTPKDWGRNIGCGMTNIGVMLILPALLTSYRGRAAIFLLVGIVLWVLCKRDHPTEAVKFPKAPTA